MKGFVVILLLLCAGVLATWQFSHKTLSSTDDIDKLAMALKGLEKISPPTGHILFHHDDAHFELTPQVRYCLAPRYLSSEAKNGYDTVLRITTSATTSLLTGEKLIWQNADSQFHYFLTCTRCNATGK